MDVVRFRRMRRDVLDSLAVLSDVEYQERAWIRGEGFLPGQYDDFDYHVHVLYDETAVLPDPADSIGTVLVPGDEIERLRNLGRLLDALLAEHGDVGASVFMADPRWPEVGRMAALALAAMVRSWGMDR
ncbi:hypothetical protein OHA10_02285 [Kribbella sp. NBC_00662]|uniref:SCO4402 family protein n=1 Tax=Kribbella sp. NBC_00662 TaxID=2975969 RepID=UPI0032533F39